MSAVEDRAADARPHAFGAREGGLAFLAFVAVTLAMTWPLATAPARLGTPNMDAYGNVWAIAWVARQLGRDPAHLFDANMFHPYAKSLAYAESLIPQALQAWPVLALGGSPLLAYNWVLILNLAGSGFGAYVLARELGAGRGASGLAGLGFGFSAVRWDHLAHVQTLSTPWLPLALVFARRTLRRGGFGNALGLAACTALQALSSGYFALLTALAVGATLALELHSSRALRRVPLLLAAAACAALPLLAVFAEYRAVGERHGLRRGLAESRAWSARPTSYLDPGPYVSLPHLVGLQRGLDTGEPLYPGLALLVFGGLALLRLRRSAAVRLAALLLLMGFLLSLGPDVRVLGLDLPGPFRLLRLLPGGALLRTPVRLGILAVLALGGLAALELTLRARRNRLLVAALLAFTLIELYPAGLAASLRPMPVAPPTVAWLAQAPRGVVLELPWNEPADSALYLYWSTGHWQPMVNGFGSFDPPGNFGLGLLGHRWPSAFSAETFREHGIRYVVVHLERLKPGQRQRVLAASALPEGVQLAFEAGSHRVYEIRRP